MEITLDLLIEDWLKDNYVLRDHFKVFRYSECDNPTSWPASVDNYIGMVCNFNDCLAFAIMDNYVFRDDSFNNKNGSMLIRTRLEAADPEFFKKLAQHLAIRHERLYGLRRCKLYATPKDNIESYTRIFDN